MRFRTLCLLAVAILLGAACGGDDTTAPTTTSPSTSEPSTSEPATTATSQPTSTAAERVGPVARGEGSSWRAVTPLGDERLAVVETCCDVGERERWHVLGVHLPTASVEGGLLPDERVEATRIDSDEGADGLLLVLVGEPTVARSIAGTRARARGRPSRMASSWPRGDPAPPR